MTFDPKLPLILNAFGKAPRQIQPISIGLIHQTYRIDTDDGRFCLQGLHPKLATDAILEDYRAVTEFLAKQGLLAPRLLATREGRDAYDAPEGVRWRLTTWLPGESLSAVSKVEMIHSAAAALGRFHRVMQEIPHTFRSAHPLHQTARHLDALQRALVAHAGSSWLPPIQPMLDHVLAELPSLLLPPLPLRVVHGDPKLSNVLFDPHTHEAIALIDLDTCARHSPLVDIGDAVRSWCREGGEDEEKEFSLERFQALLSGYASQAPALSHDEIALLPSAGRLITLELTSRFLTDVLEDSYFGWDPSKYKSRREHNLARAKGMDFLARRMKDAQPAVERIVAGLF